MNYLDEIIRYPSANEQEAQDKKVIINYIEQFQHNVLLRDNEIAHITSSGFIMNKTLNRVLMVHHNIRDVWAWTGGHADGDENLLQVALKEAVEETGVSDIHPLIDRIASIDILPVFGHIKKSHYVNAHLHLSIAYVLIADESCALSIRQEENTGVEWFPIDRFATQYFDEKDVYLYQKLIALARSSQEETY